MNLTKLFCIAVVAFLLTSNASKAQVKDSIPKNDSLRKNALNVFFNCPDCDMDYVKKGITFINYVRDQKDAQLYILMTSMVTGSGGYEYSIYFIGQKEFKGKNDTLKFSTSPDNTPDEIRQQANQMLKLGLMPYVAKTPIGKMINISYETTEDATQVKDPWKSWIFNINGSAYFNGQESIKAKNLYGSVEASKITEKLKIDLNAYYSYYDAKFKIDDTTTIDSHSDSKCISGLAAFSLGEHWSAGGMGNVTANTYNNIKLHYALYPAIEYDLYKYSESTRRQLRFLYQVGGGHTDYIDTTIYGKTKDFLLLHELTIAYKVIEKWGSISASIYGTQYFKDLTKNDLSLYASLSIRIFKGLSFNMSGDLSMVHDQLGLPKAGASEADILTQQKQLASQYTYYVNAGLTYTFGSIYNNVVNPRFSN